MGRAFEVGMPFIGWRAYEDNIGGKSGDCRRVAVCIILDGGGGGGSGRRDGYTSNLRYPGRGQRVSEGGNGYCLALFGLPQIRHLGHASHRDTPDYVKKQRNIPRNSQIYSSAVSETVAKCTPKPQNHKRSCCTPRKCTDCRPSLPSQPSPHGSSGCFGLQWCSAW